MKKIIDAYSNFKFKDLGVQFKSHLRSIIITTVFSIIVLISMLTLGLSSGVSYSNLTRDFQSIYNAPMFTSMMSHVIISLWVTASMICFYTYYLIRNDRTKPRNSRFMLVSGIFLLTLAIDDAFLGHEWFFPMYLHIPELAVLITYIFLFVSFIYFFIEEIMASDYIYFFLFCVSFVIYYIIEIFLEKATWIPGKGYFEECFKFGGVVMWINFNMHTGKKYVSESFKK